MTLISLTYPDPTHGAIHITVHQPYGGGSNWQVNINDYFVGQIVRHRTGWVSYVDTPLLTQDDIDAIMDEVERWEREEGK